MRPPACVTPAVRVVVPERENRLRRPGAASVVGVHRLPDDVQHVEPTFLGSDAVGGAVAFRQLEVGVLLAASVARIGEHRARCRIDHMEHAVHPGDAGWLGVEGIEIEVPVRGVRAVQLVGEDLLLQPIEDVEPAVGEHDPFGPGVPESSSIRADGTCRPSAS